MAVGRSAGGFPGDWALVGDIGATNARFALVDPDGALTETRALLCDDYPTITEAISAYLADTGRAKPIAAVLAVAASPTGDEVEMTNHPWTFSIEGVRQAVGLKRLKVVNDFHANAAVVPYLETDDRIQVGPGTPRRQGAHRRAGTRHGARRQRARAHAVRTQADARRRRPRHHVAGGCARECRARYHARALRPRLGRAFAVGTGPRQPLQYPVRAFEGEGRLAHSRADHRSQDRRRRRTRTRGDRHVLRHARHRRRQPGADARAREAASTLPAASCRNWGKLSRNRSSASASRPRGGFATIWPQSPPTSSCARLRRYWAPPSFSTTRDKLNSERIGVRQTLELNRIERRHGLLSRQTRCTRRTGAAAPPENSGSQAPSRVGR